METLPRHTEMVSKKAKGQLELRLSRNVKTNKMSFYDQISSKRLNKKNMRPLLNGVV